MFAVKHEMEHSYEAQDLFVLDFNLLCLALRIQYMLLNDSLNISQSSYAEGSHRHCAVSQQPATDLEGDIGLCVAAMGSNHE